MSEAEVLELINQHTSNAFSGFAVFLTLLFGYMTVAYVVGARLSKFQVTLITLLYSCTEILMTLSLLMETHASEVLIKKYPDFTYSSLQTIPFTLPSAFIESAAIIISLMFMFDIRSKAHSEKNQ
jgi:hypothetical protein